MSLQPAITNIAYFALVIATAAHHSPAEADQAEGPKTEIQAKTVTEHDRSMTTLMHGDRPICSFYAHGQLSTERTPEESGSTWTGRIKHTQNDGSVNTYTVRYVATAMSLISLSGRSFTVPTPPASNTSEDAKPRSPTFVMTSYGRPVPTGRSFEVAIEGDLTPKKQYSQAWYFDNDLYKAESRRNTLEMDDLEGWVVAWDSQHCIQHSDGARVAKFRLFADGRLIINRDHRRVLAERKIAPDEVKQLLVDLAAMQDQSASLERALLNAVKADPDSIVGLPINIDSTLIQSVAIQTPLGHGLWDQFQDIVHFRRDGRKETINVVYAGPDQRPTRIPPGWDEMHRRLHELTSK